MSLREKLTIRKSEDTEAGMNKKELIEVVTESLEMSKTDATACLDGFLDAITNALTAGDTVQLLGFGTFSVGHRAAREGRNPMTGNPIQIEAKNYIKFKGSSKLNEKLTEVAE